MSKDYMVSYDELDDILNELERNDINMPSMPSLIEENENLKEENEDLKEEINFLKKENSKLKEEVQAFYEMEFKSTSVRGSVWYLEDYDQDAIVIQTKCNTYMLIDKEAYNRWYDEEFSEKEIVGELVKRGWRIKK